MAVSFSILCIPEKYFFKKKMIIRLTELDVLYTMRTSSFPDSSAGRATDC